MTRNNPKKMKPLQYINKTRRIRPRPPRKNKTIKRMNCSPLVKNKTPDKLTCYTNQILIEIKNAYNKHPPYKNNPIYSDNPRKILDQLRKRMSGTCEKENCWLKLLSVEQQRVIADYVFAPKKPIEWHKNPTEWLSNFDILNVLRQYEKSNPTFKFIGPTSIDFDTVIDENMGKCVLDDLCHFSLKRYIDAGIKDIGIIFNLDKHTQEGSHWVSMFIDTENSFIFYFDSATNKTPKEIKALVKKIQEQATELGHQYKYYENYPNNHQRTNTECGMYSLYFIITMLDKSKSINSKIRLFKEKKVPDKHMRKLRDVYFND